MARVAENIKDLNDKKALWKLEVLIIDLWTVNNSKNKQHVEMVVCDKEVNEINFVKKIVCNGTNNIHVFLIVLIVV
jgi:hypothetical protein